MEEGETMKKVVVSFLIVLCFLVTSVTGAEVEQPRTYWELMDKARKENKRVFIMFTADWCGPCQEMKDKVLKGRIEEFLNKHYLVYYLDIDKEKDVADLYAKHKTKGGQPIFDGSIPAFYIYNNGGSHILSRRTGYMDATTFSRWHDSIYKKATPPPPPRVQPQPQPQPRQQPWPQPGGG
jgi:thioredoxin-related protein